jgi:hypothetical protein
MVMLSIVAPQVEMSEGSVERCLPRIQANGSVELHHVQSETDLETNRRGDL